MLVHARLPVESWRRPGARSRGDAASGRPAGREPGGFADDDAETLSVAGARGMLPVQVVGYLLLLVLVVVGSVILGAAAWVLLQIIGGG